MGNLIEAFDIDQDQWEEDYRNDSDAQEEEYYQTVAGGEYEDEKVLDDVLRAYDINKELGL